MRVYVPTTLAGLARFVASGQVPVEAERFVASDESEESEYSALLDASHEAAELLDGPGRRAVVVADVGDPDGAIPMRLVEAVHADTEDVDPIAGGLPDLGWFAPQEIPDLIG
jgi:hypothetical protein